MQSVPSQADDYKQINHLQHAMSSQTFMARVAFASWVNTPFLPPGTPASIIAEVSRNPKPFLLANLTVKAKPER
jgi:hypothetical protein